MSKLHLFDRRRALQALAMSAYGVSASGWLPELAARAAAAKPEKRRQCILLWMAGGPSQTDTFDMKPGHENGGEFKEVATKAPGVRFSEHLPKLAAHADKLAIIRSLNTKEGDHEPGSYLLRTGQQPMSAIQYPSMGAALAKELTVTNDKLPPYVSVAPNRSFGRDGNGPGFLGPRFAPLVVAGGEGMRTAPAAGSFAELKVDAIQPPTGVTKLQERRRLDLWTTLEDGFLQSHATSAAQAHRTVYNNALQMLQSDAAAAFDLSQEPAKVREAYGRGAFGQGCLLARRLVEQGVPFVEVSLTSSAAGSFGWDTHANNFEAVRSLSGELDAGWSMLMTELEQRGLMESTTIVWMGEFGRTPQINGQAGRDHFPRAWTSVLAGGGIAGGQVYGRTSADGMNIEEDPVGVADVLCTLCEALGVPPSTQNTANTGRPISLVDGAAIPKLLSL